MGKKNHQPINNLAEHVYNGIAYYIWIIVIILMMVIVYLFVKKTYEEMKIVQKSTRELHSIQADIMQDAQFASHIMQKHIKANPYHDIKTDLKRVAKNVTLSKNPVFNGVGFVLTDHQNPYGIIYSFDQKHRLKSQQLAKIFQSKDQTYFKTQWYSKAIKGKTAFVKRAAFKKWFAQEQGYPVSYAFPLYSAEKDKIVAIGLLDLHTDALFQKWRSIINKINLSFFGQLKVFYVGYEFKDSVIPTNKKYIPLNQNSTKPQKRVLKKRCLDNISLSWSFCQGALQKQFSFFNGNIKFIVTFNLLQTIIRIILILFILLVITSFITFKLMQTNITHRLKRLTKPLSDVTAYAKAIAANQSLEQQCNIAKHQHANIYEIKELTESFEKMRLSLKDRLEKESKLQGYQSQLKLASSIQQKFIASEYSNKLYSSEFQYKFRSIFKPAGELSGDIVDSVITHNYIYFLIGDSTGKSVSAAIFSLFILNKFRSLTENLYSPEIIMAKINNFVCEMDADNMFMTAICIRIDLKTDEITLANAGHDEPILIDNQNNACLIKQNQKCDLFLGIQSNMDYCKFQFKAHKIKNLFCYTDGLTEAKNDNNEMFGEEALMDIIANNPDISYSLAHEVLKVVEQFEGKDQAYDDKTILSLQVKPFNNEQNQSS